MSDGSAQPGDAYRLEEERQRRKMNRRFDIWNFVLIGLWAITTLFIGLYFK